MAKRKKAAKAKSKKAAKKSAKKVVKLAAKKPAAKAQNGNGLPRPIDQAMGPGGQGARRRQNPRFHPRAIGADLHATARLHGRRRDQSRTARRRRYHAHAIARREGAGQPLFHHAQWHQALDHHRFQAPQGQGNPRSAGEDLRRAGGEFRAGRARPHGPDLGAHPQAQSAHDRRLGEGFRPGSL